MEWQRGVGALSSAWAGFKAFFINIAHQMFYGALAAGEILWHGLEVAWIETTAFLSKAWTNFTSTFRSAWNTAVTWVEKRIHDLWGLLDRDYDAEAAKQLADQMLSVEKDAIERQRRQDLDEREQKRNRDRKRAAEQHEGTLGVIGEEYERAKERLDVVHKRAHGNAASHRPRFRQRTDRPRGDRAWHNPVHHLRFHMELGRVLDE